MPTTQVKDPVRSVNTEYLSGLEVLSNKVFALPGAICRGGDRDARFTHLEAGTAEMVLFNHLATIKHRSSGMIFVAFRQTMDALHLEQRDITKYPEWLMDSSMKKTELRTFIHSVKPPYDKNPGRVLNDRMITDVSAQTRVDRWLQAIDTVWVFDTIAYFLLKNQIITDEMYGRI